MDNDSEQKGEVVETQEVVPATQGEAEQIVPATEEKAGGSIQGLISLAITQKVPVETLERLLALQEKWQASQAKQAYVEAMAKFQGECPTVKKQKAVFEKNSTTKVRYRFASIDSIVDQVRKHLAANGLSYAVDTIQEEGFVTAVCKVTHEMGHSETSQFKIPIDKDSYMSGPQRFAAALTFAKRYAFCNALGIMTGDDDSDASPETVNAPQQARQPYARPAGYQAPRPPQQPAAAPYPPRPVDPAWDNVPCPNCGVGIMETVPHTQVPEKWLHKCSMFGKQPANCKMVIRIAEQFTKVNERLLAMNAPKEPVNEPIADDGHMQPGENLQSPTGYLEPPVEMDKLTF